MEYWDIYDRDRQKTGRVHQRGRPMKKGEYHLSAFVWVFDSRGCLLLTRRSPEKVSYPNLWAVTGGAALAGETSLQAVARELQEETGLMAQPEEFELMGSFARKNTHCDVYFLHQDAALEALILQPGETCDAMWATREQFLRMAAEGQIARPDVSRFRFLRRKLETVFH